MWFCVIAKSIDDLGTSLLSIGHAALSCLLSFILRRSRVSLQRYTVLIMATCHGRLLVADALIKAKADVNAHTVSPARRMPLLFIHTRDRSGCQCFFLAEYASVYQSAFLCAEAYAASK